MRGPRARVLLFLLVLVALTTMLPGTARAGCLREYNTCDSCARDRLKQAIVDFDLRGIREANLDRWDCGIDLHHCLFYGQHHEYPCGR